MDDVPLSPPARSAIDAYGERTSRPPTDAQLDAIWKAAAVAHPRARAAPRRIWVGAVVFAALAIAVVVRDPWQADAVLHVSPPPEALQPTSTAQWRRDGDAVTLDRGGLRVQPHGDQVFAVVTPQVRVLVQRAAAIFEVGQEATVIAVESGEVEWRAGSRRGRVVAGERVTIAATDSDLSLPPRGAPLKSCAGAEYEACLERASAGSGLVAQTALYELALVAHERGDLSRAMQLFGSYAARFPNGAFGPEASIGLMLDLRATDKAHDARAEALKFGTRFPSDPRAAAVLRWGAQIP